MADAYHPNAVLIKQVKAELDKHQSTISQAEYERAETEFRLASLLPEKETVVVRSASFWPWLVFFLLVGVALDYIGLIDKWKHMQSF